MKLSIASWSFSQCTLAEAAAIARAIGIPAIDLGYLHHPAIDRAQVVREPERYAEQLCNELPVSPACLFHRFGTDRMERNLGLPPVAGNFDELPAVLRFCRRAGIAQLFVLPGMINSGQSRAQALANAAESLRPMVAAGAEVGIAVAVEPHVHGLIENREQTEELLAGVPGLRLVLDVAHFVAQGYPQSDAEALIPHVAHVHLRQARPGALQAPLELGTINFPALFAALRATGYCGWLSLEVVHQAYMDTLHEDVLTETIRLRDCFRNWSSAASGAEIR